MDRVGQGQQEAEGLLALRRACDTVRTHTARERNWRNQTCQHSFRAVTSLGLQGQGDIAHGECCDGRIQAFLEKQAGK